MCLFNLEIYVYLVVYLYLRSYQLEGLSPKLLPDLDSTLFHGLIQLCIMSILSDYSRCFVVNSI